MSIQKFILAGLLSSAGAVYAGPGGVDSTPPAALGAWTASAGSVNVLGSVDVVAMMLAGGSSKNWSQRSLTGDNPNLVLFSLNTKAQGGTGGGAGGGAPGSNAPAGNPSSGNPPGGNPPGGNPPGGNPPGDGAPGRSDAPIGTPGGGQEEVNADDPAAAVPEPESIALMLIGLAGMGFMGRRRAR